MNWSDVTALVVNYRSSELVADLLATFCDKLGRDMPSVLVVDNASGDNSVDLIRRGVRALDLEGRVEVLASEQNRGFGAGNNVGLAHLRKRSQPPAVVWMLNPDTRIIESRYELALDWFADASDVGIVGTGILDPDGAADLGGHRAPTPMSEFASQVRSAGLLRRFTVSDAALQRPGPVDWVSGASMLVRWSMLEEVGAFDEGYFLYFEEVDLCRRAVERGWRCIYEPRCSVVHLEGHSTGVNGSRPKPKYWYDSRRRYFVKHFGVPGLASADLLWALGRGVAAVQRRGRMDGIRWSELWSGDLPVILGRESCP